MRKPSKSKSSISDEPVLFEVTAVYAITIFHNFIFIYLVTIAITK